MDPKIVEEVLRVLVSPGTSTSGGLEDAFKTNIKKLDDMLKSSEKFAFIREHLSEENLGPEADVKWHFVQLNLNLILLLQSALDESVAAKERARSNNRHTSEKVPKIGTEPEPPADALSISQQKTVGSSLQFIVCLGICPFLLPGVGIPLNVRSEFGSLLEGVDSSDHLGRDEMDSRLLRCTKALLTCTDSTLSSVLGEMVISKHLGDLLAALLQFRYSLGKELRLGDSKTQTHDAETRESETQDSMAGRPVKCNKTESFEYCMRKLDFLLEKGNQPMVIQQLLMLQNGIPPSSKVKSVKLSSQPVLPPVWLKKLTQRCLIQAFVQPRGIESLFAVLLQGQIENTSVDWKKYQAIAKIVVDCPLGKIISMDDYYEKISGQILNLLRMNDPKRRSENVPVGHLRHCLRAGVQMVSQMALRQPHLVQKYFMDVLLGPLLRCVEKPGHSVRTASSGHFVVVEENTLTSCLEDVHLLLIGGGGPEDDLVLFTSGVIGVLFPLYCHALQSVTHLRKTIKEIVEWIFHRLDLPVLLNFLSQFCLGIDVDINSQLIPGMCKGLGFSGGECGGISIVFQAAKLSSCDRKPALDIGHLETLAENVVHLIVSAKRQDDLGAELFLCCLKRLSDMLSQEIDSRSSGDSIHLGHSGKVVSGSCLLDSSDVAGAMAETIERNLTILSFIAVMCDKISPSCLKNTSHILSFVEATLTRGVKVLTNTSDPAFSAFEAETLTMALSLLTSLFASRDKLSGLDWKRLDEFLPLLQKILESDVDESLHEMSLDLRIAIATHGLVRREAGNRGRSSGGSGKTVTSGITPAESMEWKPGEILEDERTQRQEENDLNKVTPGDGGGGGKVRKPLIEVVESSDAEMPENRKAVHPEHSSASISSASSEKHQTFSAAGGETESLKEEPTGYQQVVEELCDSMVPVRGHGLIALRRLIENRDAETLAHSEDIVEFCRLNLSHPDSYIYLSAVQVMAVLADRCPLLVVPQLAREYSLSSKDSKRSPELQMKLGEVLVKVSSGLGETIPYYRDLLLNAVLSAARDPEPLVQASAISNLGQICQLLRFSLGNVIQEIFSCIQNFLKSHESVEVRRSAAMFSTLLLRGLSKDTFAVLAGLLVDFHRLLKHVRTIEKDEVVLLHVQLTVEELDLIVRDFLKPSPSMTKRISLLGPFD